MGVHDRDWYRDAIRRREAKAERQHQSPPLKTTSPKIHWTLRVLWWGGILLLAYIIERKILWPIVERALTH